ncbi:MAG: RidA family protein [Chitinophagales bacterium]|nr:RidA family protein [Chitinophagales bacterium]
MIIKKMEELGYSYSPSSIQVGDLPFGSATRVGNLVFTSGQIPIYNTTIIKGKVGNDVTLEQAIKAAEICAFNCVRAAGSIVHVNSIVRVVKILGLVNCAADFNDTSSVINGGSKFFNYVFENTGLHARTAIGAVIPSNWAVEIEAIFEVQ